MLLSDFLLGLNIAPVKRLGFQITKPQSDEAVMTEPTTRKPRRNVISGRTIAPGTTITTAALAASTVTASTLST